MSAEGEDLPNQEEVSANIEPKTENSERPSTQADAKAEKTEEGPENVHTTIPEETPTRSETKTHEEYEKVEDGKRTKVKTSKAELKEYSHTFRSKVYGPTSDVSGFDFPEFKEFDTSTWTRPESTSYGEGPSWKTQTVPVRKINETEIPISKDRVIIASRPTEKSEVKIGVSVRVANQKSKDAGHPSSMVSPPIPSVAERVLYSGTSGFPSEPPSAQTTLESEATKESMQRRIITLESDLRNSKKVSELISDELHTLRKQYEYMVNKSLQIENTNRAMHEKLRDLKSINKKMARDLEDREQLVDRLHEAYSREKQTQRYISEIKEEHNKLVRDYEVLRQTYNRKKQQMNSLFTERTELFQRLDKLEYERQQLEQRAGVRSKSSSYLRHSVKVQERGTKKHMRGSFPTASSPTLTRYGQLPEELVPPKSGQDDDTITNQPDATENDITPTTSQAVKTEKQNEEEPKEVGAQPVTVVPVERDRTKFGLKSPESERFAGQDSGQPDYATDETFRFDEPLYSSDEYCRKPISRILANGDVANGANYKYYCHLSDSRMHTYRKQYTHRHHERVANEAPHFCSLDNRADSYRRPRMRPRPASAMHGPPPRDYEIYYNPLPPRPKTSLGRRHEYRLRSPEREYWRTYKASRRRHCGISHSKGPNPFKYDSVRRPRNEISQLEYSLAELRHEKNRIERELYAGHLTRSRGRSEELSDMLIRIGFEIDNLQSRLAVLKACDQ